MPIPSYQTLMLPLLKIAGDGNEHRLKDLYRPLASQCNLTEEEFTRLLPSGNSTLFRDRVQWAKTYLAKAGLLIAPRWGYFKIMDEGQNVIRSNPKDIDVNFLRQYDSFNDFIKPSSPSSEKVIYAADEEQRTPEEILERTSEGLRSILKAEILQKVKQCTPEFFEDLVVKLLVAMGYGGTLKDAGQATQRTADEGIDGIIKEDRLGLDVIYVQAKRWGTTSVGRPDIQSFVGALDGKRANKGIFITTSTFASTASSYVKDISKKVILIDGQELAELMIDYNLGVSTQQIIEVKKVDNDFFDE